MMAVPDVIRECMMVTMLFFKSNWNPQQVILNTRFIEKSLQLCSVADCAHSYCSIGSIGVSEQACTSISSLGKHLLHKEPHFDVLVNASETAEPKRHPHAERRFCFGSTIASRGTRWHRPLSLTFTT